MVTPTIRQMTAAIDAILAKLSRSNGSLAIVLPSSGEWRDMNLRLGCAHHVGC